MRADRHGVSGAEGADRLLGHLFDSRPESGGSEERIGLAGSLALHILILALLLWAGTHPHLAVVPVDMGVGDGIGAGAAGGGGGGGERITYVRPEAAPSAAPAAETPPEPEPVPPPQPKPIPTPEIPVPRLAPLAPAVSAVSAPLRVAALADGGGTGSGSGTGPGTGPGSGGGTGGGEGGGVGSGVGPGTGKGHVLAPSPEFLLLPPTPAPGNVRGKTVVVRLAIDAAGSVRDVELVPPTGDHDYDKALRRTALGWRFRPARDARNQPMAITYDVTFTF